MDLRTYIKCDGVANELRVLLHNFFDALLLTVFCLILFEVEDHFCASANGLS